jgi:hypothetical protein
MPTGTKRKAIGTSRGGKRVKIALTLSPDLDDIPPPPETPKKKGGAKHPMTLSLSALATATSC